MDEMYYSYLILSSVIYDGAYLDQAIKKHSKDYLENKKINSELIYTIVYGVLERNIALEQALSLMVNKKPDKRVYLVLKIAIYIFAFLDSMPDYAIVDNAQKLTEKVGKKQLKGFVNAVLRNFIAKNDIDDIKNSLSKPKYLIDKLIKTYGEEKAVDILKVRGAGKATNVRVNNRLFTNNEFEDYLNKNKINYTKTVLNSYKISNLAKIDHLFKQGKVTYQSLSSMLAVYALSASNNASFLDMCSAPGGKLIFANELYKNLHSTAFEIHQHRIDLISSYRYRMQDKSDIKIIKQDATEYVESFSNSFDYILCDTPCSGTGVLNKNPDILLTLSKEGIKELTIIQKKILSNAIKYAKKGAIIVYSTCSLLEDENEQITNYFVNEGLVSYDKIEIEDISINGKITLFPYSEFDGFYIARLKKL